MELESKFNPTGVRILEQYDLTLPQWLSEWDAFSYWEKERFDSIKQHLKKGDLIIEVGVENGWNSAIIAKYITGSESMVLCEPAQRIWPNIKHIWAINDLPKPLACFAGLVGDQVKNNPKINSGGWPKSATEEIPTSDRIYSYIHEHGDFLPQTTIDSMGFKPNALNIDVEGAELLVLRGAVETLKKYRPFVWVSIHPDLAKKDYQVSDHEIHDFMRSVHYTGKELAIDHEVHVFYYPNEIVV